MYNILYFLTVHLMDMLMLCIFNNRSRWSFSLRYSKSSDIFFVYHSLIRVFAWDYSRLHFVYLVITLYYLQLRISD